MRFGRVCANESFIHVEESRFTRRSGHEDPASGRDITVQELADEVGTSAPSIRRDLKRLEKRGLILRTHGGAALVEPLLYEPFRHDTSFQSRELRAADAKRRIGLAAAELVGEKDIIGLTAGTTTTQVGRSLRHRKGITVITNALNIGMELCNQPSIKTMLTGGTHRPYTNDADAYVLDLEWCDATGGLGWPPDRLCSRSSDPSPRARPASASAEPQ